MTGNIHSNTSFLHLQILEKSVHRFGINDAGASRFQRLALIFSSIIDQPALEYRYARIIGSGVHGNPRWALSDPLDQLDRGRNPLDLLTHLIIS